LGQKKAPNANAKKRRKASGAAVKKAVKKPTTPVAKEAVSGTSNISSLYLPSQNIIVTTA
jgi:hypothetical protein